MLRKALISVILLSALGICARAQILVGSALGFKSSDEFSAGAVVQVMLPGGFAVQSGLMYQTKELSFRTPAEAVVDTVIETVTSSYGYLEVPLQLQWGVDLILFRPYCLAEGFLGYATKSHYNEYARERGLSKSSFEHGVAIGGGLELWKLQLSAKYYWNLGGSRQTRFKGLAITGVWFF